MEPRDGVVSSGLPLVVEVATPGALDDAEHLAAELGAPCRRAHDGTPSSPNAADELVLRFDARGLTLARGALSLQADFADLVPRIKPENLSRELLVRAVRLKDAAHLGRPPVVADATAGLGADSFLLAAAGWEVRLFESDRVIAALLADAIRRARLDPALASAAGRMHLTPGDSITELPALEGSVDAVYLDPMFPERKKSAAVKKKFQLLHLLERPCSNQEELLEAALAARPRKVVVKRPIKGPHLAGIKPSHTLAGKAVRYDVIVPPRA